MSDVQKKILIGTACVIALMVLVPPYTIKNYKQTMIGAGYGLIFDLPPLIENQGKTIAPATVNTSTLYAQMIGALLVGGLLTLAAAERRPKVARGESLREPLGSAAKP